MRTLLFCLIILFSQTVFAQKQKTIIVKTAEELAEAIGPNRIIKIDADWIFISDIPLDIKKTYYDTERFYGFNIEGVSNLKIIGMGKKKVKFIAQNPNANVFAMFNCNNIVLENLEMGHGPGKGSSCIAGVLGVFESKNVRINNCILFGSGIYGLWAANSSELVMKDVLFRGCSQNIMNLSNTHKAHFINCEFSDNTATESMFDIGGSKDVLFENCDIQLNRVDADILENGGNAVSVFDTEAFGGNVILKNSSIVCNAAQYLATDKNALKMENCKVDKNYFSKKEYQK